MALLYTHHIIGFPHISARGLPGKRLDLYLAGIIPNTFIAIYPFKQKTPRQFSERFLQINYKEDFKAKSAGLIRSDGRSVFVQTGRMFPLPFL